MLRKNVRIHHYPPPLQGSLKPLKKIILLPNLFSTLLISCPKPDNNYMFGLPNVNLYTNSLFVALIMKEDNNTTHIATKLSSDPIASRLNVISTFAI